MTKVHILSAVREELDRHKESIGLVSTHTHINNEHLTVVYQDGGAISRFHIINKAWSVERIRATIHENTSKNINSIFLVDRRIMPLKTPGETTSKAIESWLATLSVLTDGSIYIYDPAESWSIRPVHIEKDYIVGIYTAQLFVGDVVDFSAMQPGIITTKSDLLNGLDKNGSLRTRSYMFTHFGQLKFWRTREEAAKRERQRQEEDARRRREEQERQQSKRDDWQYRSHSGHRGEWRNSSFNDDFSNFGNFYDWWRGYQSGGFGGSARQERSHNQTYAGGSDYSVLGIDPSASDGEVKQAYRALARHHHPDTSKDPNATAVMQRINAAYESIKKARRMT